jgi:hypothetical protein
VKDAAELISAVASLLWPLFAFTSLFVFKKQIGDLVGRIKRGKLLGQEIELVNLSTNWRSLRWQWPTK